MPNTSRASSSKKSFSSSSQTKVSKSKKKAVVRTLYGYSWYQLCVALVFLCAFAGVGSYYIHKSSASTWLCVQHYYYEYEPGTYKGSCVYQIQYSLNDLAHLYKGATQASDGIFGPTTRTQVLQFQKWHTATVGAQTPDGEIGNGTWIKLCVELDNYGYRGQANNDGCGANVNLYTYGEYPAALTETPLFK